LKNPIVFIENEELDDDGNVIKSASKQKEDSDEPLEIPLPDISGGEFLMALFNEAGTAIQTGMGLVPLSWQELDSWLRCTQLELSPWEVRTIKSMSNAYANEYAQASKKDRPRPYNPEVREEISKEDLAKERELIASQAMSVFAQFKKK
jgi:hypothetical protein